MREKLKEFGCSILSLGLFIGLILLAVAFIYGAAWTSAKVFPWLYAAFFPALGFALFISLPLSFFRRTRAFAANSFYIVSFIFGLNLWCFSLLLTLFLWGTMAVFIGLGIVGVGIAPVALMATAFKGEWEHFLDLVILLVLTFGCRVFSLYLIGKTRQANE